MHVQDTTQPQDIDRVGDKVEAYLYLKDTQKSRIPRLTTTWTNTVPRRVVVVFVRLTLIGHGVIGLSESELEFSCPSKLMTTLHPS
jgi:hypothetical protein